MSIGATWYDEESGWLIRAGADTQIGNYREQNEDFVLLDPELPLALVLDGMGSQPAGERAARVGAEVIRDRVRVGHANGEPADILLEAAFQAGHDAVVHLGRTPEFRNCGATVVAAWIQDGQVHVAWLGDSPAFRVSGARLERLTWNHDLRTLLIRSGRLTEAEARYARFKNVLFRYLGAGAANDKLEIRSFVPRPGDRLILATDGGAGWTPDETIPNACRDISDPTTCAEAINEHALMAGSRDNCSCAVLAFERVDANPFEGERVDVNPLPEPSPPPAALRTWWRFWR
jgi:protein phosphatase